MGCISRALENPKKNKTSKKKYYKIANNPTEFYKIEILRKQKANFSSNFVKFFYNFLENNLEKFKFFSNSVSR